MKRLRTAQDLSRYGYVTQLDGTSYRVRLHWNRRTAGWYISLSAADGTALAKGVRVVCNYDLFGELYDSRLPPGVIFALSLDPNDTSPPGFDDLGNRVRLLYMTRAEQEGVIAALADDNGIAAITVGGVPV